jgi:hypothetical protein
MASRAWLNYVTERNANLLSDEGDSRPGSKARSRAVSNVSFQTVSKFGANETSKPPRLSIADDPQEDLKTKRKDVSKFFMIPSRSKRPVSIFADDI